MIKLVLSKEYTRSYSAGKQPIEILKNSGEGTSFGSLQEVSTNSEHVSFG